jgi:hypothetical protein
VKEISFLQQTSVVSLLTPEQDNGSLDFKIAILFLFSFPFFAFAE